MGKLPKYIFIFLFVLGTLSAPAQKSKIDSLLAVLAKTGKDTNRVLVLMDLSKASEDTTKESFYLEQARSLSKELKYAHGEVNAEVLFGYYFMFHNVNFPKAAECYTRALKIYKDLNEQNGVAHCYHQLGCISMNYNDYPSATTYFQKAISINSKIKNDKLLRMNYNMMGSLLMKQHQYDSALKYYKYSEVLSIKGKLPTHVLYVNISSCYLSMKNIDSSRKYIQMTDSSYKARNSDYGVHWVNMLSGQLELLTGNFKRALTLLKEPYDYSIMKNDDELYVNTAPYLVQAFKNLGNYKEAFLVQEKLNFINDSLNGVENAATVRAIEHRFETEEKDKFEKLKMEKLDAEHRAEVNRQRIIIWTSSVSLIFAIAFGLFIFRVYRQKQKANVIITHQKLLVEEKQKEILDSIHYAQRIQKSLLPTEAYIKKSIDRLQKNA